MCQALLLKHNDTSGCSLEQTNLQQDSAWRFWASFYSCIWDDSYMRLAQGFNHPTFPLVYLIQGQEGAEIFNYSRYFKHPTSNPRIGYRQQWHSCCMAVITGLSDAEVALHVILQVVMAALHTNTQSHSHSGRHTGDCWNFCCSVGV